MGSGIGQSKKRQGAVDGIYRARDNNQLVSRAFTGTLEIRGGACFDGEGGDMREESVDGAQASLSCFGTTFATDSAAV